MKSLSPFEVYFLASTVYTVRQAENSFVRASFEKKVIGGFKGVSAPFNPTTLTTINGTSGIRFKPKALNFLSASSGFGFLAQRVGNGMKEFVLVTRGTDSTPDWLTNVQAGWASGPTDHIVHKGFNDTFNSYRAQLDGLLRDVGPPPAIIHCVGHSLGGALANLNAALLTARGYTVALYTLGAPRVGYYPFASNLETKLKGRVHRVANRFDPVGMLPVFPFCHAAVNQDTYLTHAGGNIISVDAHSVDPNKPGYAVCMNDPRKTWADLKQPIPRASHLHETLDDCIKLVGGGLLFNGHLLILIGQALYKLCSAVSQAALMTTQRFINGCAEATDRLAEMLLVAAAAGAAKKEEAKAILRAICQFLGRPSGFVADQVTVALVRWALIQLSTELAGRATLAVARRY